MPMMKNPIRPKLEKLKPGAFFGRHLPLLILLIAALVIRIFLFRSVVPRVHTDTVSYLILQDLASVRTPGYPLFLEVIQFFNDLFSITPRYLLYIVFFQMFILGLINTYLIFAASRILTRSDLFSLVMGLLFNLDYLVVGFEFILLTETLSLTLLGLTLLFYLKIFRGEKSAPYLAGLFSLALVLTRPGFAPLSMCLLGLTGFIYFRPWAREGVVKRWIKPMAIFLLINIAGIGLWSWRNQLKHGFFGISAILPYQLGYFTQDFFWKYKPGSDPEMDRYVPVLEEVKGQPYEFMWRLKENEGLSDSEISQILLRLNLRLIRENFGDYLQHLPRAADYYYSYNWDWTSPYNKRIFNMNRPLANFYRFFFQICRPIFKNTSALLILILLIPVAFIIASRKEREIFHWLCTSKGPSIPTFS